MFVEQTCGAAFSYLALASAISARSRLSGQCSVLLPPSMRSIFAAHATFLSAARASLPSDEFRRTSEQHVLQVSKALQSIGTPTLEDAAATLECIKASCLDIDLQTRVVEVVNNLARAAVVVGSEHQAREVLRPQEHHHMHRYMTESDWKILQDESLPFQAKAKRVAERGQQIGLLSLTEKSSVAIAAFVITVHGQPCDLNEAYERLQIIKESWKRMRNNKLSCAKPTCQVFPSLPAEFEKLYPEVYTDEKHCPCKVDEGIIIQLRQKLPARRTHNSLRQDQMMTTKSSFSSPGGMEMARVFQQALQFAMGNNMLQISPTRGGQNSMLGSPSFPATSPSQSPHSEQQHLLALPAPPGEEHPLRRQQSLTPRFAEEPSPDRLREEPAEIDCAPPADAAQRPTLGIDAAVAAVENAMAAKAAKAAGCTQSGKAHPKVMAKTAAKGKAKAKGKAHASPKAAGKVIASIQRSRPAMPPMRKTPVMRYNGCSIYSSEPSRKWRAVADKNRRYDKAISWSKAESGWSDIMQWCEENGDPGTK